MAHMLSYLLIFSAVGMYAFAGHIGLQTWNMIQDREHTGAGIGIIIMFLFVIAGMFMQHLSMSFTGAF